MDFQVIMDSLHTGSCQILMLWYIYAIYNLRDLVECYGALGKTVDDDQVEAFEKSCNV